MPEIPERRNGERAPLVKICDDAPVGGKPTEWKFDPDVKMFRRYREGVPIRKISADNIPDPYELMKSRKATIDTLIKYVSAEKLESYLGSAKDPDKALDKALESRNQPSEATIAMYNHLKKEGLINA